MELVPESKCEELGKPMDVRVETELCAGKKMFLRADKIGAEKDPASKKITFEELDTDGQSPGLAEEGNGLL